MFVVYILFICDLLRKPWFKRTLAPNFGARGKHGDGWRQILARGKHGDGWRQILARGKHGVDLAPNICRGGL